MSIDRLVKHYGYETTASLARELAPLLHLEARPYQQRLAKVLKGESAIDFPLFIALYRVLSLRGCSLERLFRDSVESNNDLLNIFNQSVELNNSYFDFRVLESSIDLVINSGGVANWKKTFSVESLKPGLKRLNAIDSYHCAKDNISPVSISPGTRCVKREFFFPYHESIVDIELDYALGKGERTECSLSYSGRNIPEGDLIFLATKVKFQTDSTALQVSLPIKDLSQPAELCIYDGDMACRERNALSRQVVEWDENRCGFSISIPKPSIDHWYVLYWTKALIDL